MRFKHFLDFLLNLPFLYSLKTSKNQRLKTKDSLTFSGSIEISHWDKMFFLQELGDTINSLHATSLFLYPLKTENLWFSDVSWGGKERPVAWNEWISLTLSWRRPLSYRNQSIDLRSKSLDWFLYDNGLRHERVKPTHFKVNVSCFTLICVLELFTVLMTSNKICFKDYLERKN